MSLLPDGTVAFLAIAVIFENVPYIKCFTAKTYRNFLVKTVYCIYYK